MRSFRMLSLAESMPGLPGLNGGKTYAAWPVWSGSYRDEVRFAPMPKKKALKLYHKARAWNRQKFPGRYGGTLGSAAMRVLECLIFDFLNFATGRLDPGYRTIARKTAPRALCAFGMANMAELRNVPQRSAQRHQRQSETQPCGFYMVPDSHRMGMER
jgi:hypothetical protein